MAWAKMCGGSDATRYPIDLRDYSWTNGINFITHNTYPEEFTSDCRVKIPSGGYLMLTGGSSPAGQGFYPQIRISTDNGTTWTTISTSAWNGRQTSVNAIIDLSAYANQTVILREWFAKDFSGNPANWVWTKFELGKV